MMADRVVTSVDPPAFVPLTSEEVFDEHGNPKIEAIRQHFSRQGRLNKEDALRIVELADKTLRQEPSLLQLSSPITGIFHLVITYLYGTNHFEQFVEIFMDNSTTC